MIKLFKRIGLVLVAFIVLFFLTLFILSLTINPNRFKPLISDQVMKATGRTLTFAGDLHWSVFPSLGIKVEKVSLSNPAGFDATPFVSVDEAKLSVHLLPLIQGQIRTGDLVLQGATLNLIKNASGQNNWTFTSQTPQTTPAASDSTAQPAKRSLSLVIPSVEIHEGTLNYQDQQAKQSMTITHIHVLVKDMAMNKPFPVLLQLAINSQKPSIQGSLSLDGALTLQQTTPGATTDVLKTTAFNGQLTVTQLSASNFKVSRLSSPITMQNGLIQLSKIVGNLYQGKLDGNAALNMQPAVPTMNAQAALSNINIQPLMKDMANQSQFKGTLNASANVNARGFNTLVSTLNGNAKVDLQKGAFANIDIIHWIKMGAAMIRHESSPSDEGGNQTDVGDFSATAKIQNGVVQSNDINWTASDFLANGYATADLNAQKLDVHLDANLPGDRALDFPIPIIISGKLSRPLPGLDIPKLTQLILQQQVSRLKDRAQDKLKEQAQDALQNLTKQFLNR